MTDNTENGDGDNGKTDELRDLFIETTGTEVVTEEQEESAKEGLTEIDEDDQERSMPKTDDVECDNCGNGEAYWDTEQTRASDEPETRFYICTECDKKWREY
jgi:DNA-directed RNA polymerase subunit M